MAEGFFRKAVAGREDFVALGSAGVSAYDGDKISPETAAELKRSAASLDDFRSRAVTKQMLKEATHVFAMTNAHLSALTRSFPSFEDKCHLVCDFIEINGQAGLDVPDPIGMGAPAYQQVSKVLSHAIPALISFIESEDQQLDS